MTCREGVLAALFLKEPGRVPFLDAYLDPTTQKILLLKETLSAPVISEATKQVLEDIRKEANSSLKAMSKSSLLVIGERKVSSESALNR